MQSKSIRLSSIQDAKEFVLLASRCEFDIDLYSGHVVIDGKSIIGVLSLDLHRVLTVKYSGNNEAFEEFLKAHKAADSTAA